MMQHRLWRIGIAAILSIAGILLLRAQGPFQIYPTAGTDGGPVLIVVLADHFKSDEESAFNDAADNFINVELMTDPFYSIHAGSFTVKRIFSAWDPSGAESNYGFKVEVGVTNCSVSWNNDGVDTATAVAAAAAPAEEPGKDAPRIVVIGNHTNPIGCAQGEWVYVGKGAFGHEIVRHEMGHMLGGLFDEYAIDSHVNDAHPTPPDSLNCSSDQDPHWNDALDPPQPTCDLYGLGVFHPTAACKMGVTKRGPFCEVCQFWMSNFFSPNPELDNPDIENPDVANPNLKAPKAPTGLKISGAGFFGQPAPQPPPVKPAPPQPTQPVTQSVRVLLQITTGTQTARVLRVTDAAGPVRSNYQRRGDYVYEVSEQGKVLGIGVLTGDPFDTRGYQGSGPTHSIGTAPTGTVLVTISGETRQSLIPGNRAVEIWIYKLVPGLGSGPVTPNRFLELKAKDQASRLFRVPPDVLKSAIQ